MDDCVLSLSSSFVPPSVLLCPLRSAHLTALKLMASSILDDGSDGTAGGGAMPTVVTDVLGAAINGATGGDEGNGYGGGACFEAFSAQLTTYQEDSEHLYRVLRCMKVFTDEDGESNGGKKSVAAAAATAKLRVSDDDGDEAFCENLFGFAVVAPAATVEEGGTENGGNSSSSGSESESESEGNSSPVELSKNSTGKNATTLLAEESAKVQTLIALIAAGLREEAPFTFGTSRREREKDREREREREKERIWNL